MAEMMQNATCFGFSKIEKEPAKELQLLGTLGIIREAFKILFLSSRSKLLWAFALTLILPLSAASVGSNFIFGPLLTDFISEWRKFLVAVAVYILICYALWMLSTVTTVYTAGSIYTANTKELKLSYITILRADVPRVWKRLTLTFLCFFMIFSGFLIALLIIVSPLMFLIFKFDSRALTGALIGLLILVVVAAFCLLLYVGTVLHLATVISVLEDKYYGLAAMRKSRDLIKGKRRTVLALVILDIIFSVVIGGTVNGFADRLESNEGVGITAVYVIFVVGFLCFVNLMELLTQTVLYFVCKSLHRESVDDISSFKFYNEATSIHLELPRADV